MGFKYLQVKTLHATSLLIATLFVMCMLFVNSAKAQSEAVVSGKILNLPTRILHYHYRNNPFLLEESENYVALDANDSFNIRFQLLSPQIVYIDLMGTKLKLFIAPNDNLNIKLDCKKKISEAIFEGNNASNNTFLAKSIGQIPDWVDETEIKKAQKSKTAQEYQTYIESLFEEKKHFLDNYPISEKSNFSADFLDFLFYDLHFWKSRVMIEYYEENKNNADPLRKPDESAKTSTSTEVIAENKTEEPVHGTQKIVSDLDKFNQSKTETIFSPKPIPQPTKTEYKPAEERPSRILITDVNQPDLKILVEDLKSAEQKKLPPVSKVSETIKPLTSSTTTVSNFAAGKYFLPDPSLNTDAEVVPLYKPTSSESMKFNGLTINERIPDFTFEDINGKEIKSKELLGKIVYLDFWATWCAPCQAEMTRAQGMAERLKDKDIVFIFVSTDEDGQAWRNQVQSEKYLGIHANDRVIIPINFMVEALPNYFIIDKKGRVAFNSLIKSHYTSEEMVEKLLSIP